MGIAKHHYVPALKWRMGEYQALFRLSDAQKDAITPLIMIPPREYDFEELRMKKTIHEHIEPFAKRMLNKWGTRPAIIDIHDSLEEAIMNSGDRVYPYIFEKLRELECNAIPVINFRRGGLFSSDIIQLIATDSQGVALRISLEDLMTPSINSDISSKLYELQVNRSETDLIIDLQEPESFEPYTDFSAALASTIGDIDHLTQFRSFVITGMSLKLSNIKKPGNVTPRHEWNLYKQLAADLVDLRVPSYGDYTIETPQFAEQDMRKMKPAGKIVYTRSEEHTSETPSRGHLVCRLLLEKKKTNTIY